MTINKPGHTESYYERNKEICKEKARNYYWNNRDRQRKKQKEYTEKLKHIYFVNRVPEFKDVKNIQLDTPEEKRRHVQTWNPTPADFTIRFDK